MHKIKINTSWCKGCGICVAICPKNVLVLGESVVEVKDKESCIACRQCEYHCPDFAIVIGDKDNG